MTAQTANKTARRTTKRPATVIAQLVLTALQAAGAIGGGEDGRVLAQFTRALLPAKGRVEWLFACGCSLRDAHSETKQNGARIASHDCHHC